MPHLDHRAMKTITVPTWTIDELGHDAAQAIVRRVNAEARSAGMTDQQARALAVETLEHEAETAFDARMAKAWGFAA